MTMFFGAAATEADAVAALEAVDAEIYSLGQPSTPDGPDARHAEHVHVRGDGRRGRRPVR